MKKSCFNFFSSIFFMYDLFNWYIKVVFNIQGKKTATTIGVVTVGHHYGI